MELDRARAGVVTSNTTTGIAGQEERPYSNVIEVLFLLSLASRNALFQNKINKYTGEDSCTLFFNGGIEKYETSKG